MSLLNFTVSGARQSVVGLSLGLSLASAGQALAVDQATNTARISTPDGSDFNPDNNTSTDSDTVVRLSLGKVAQNVAGPDAEGEYTANYRITVANPTAYDAVFGELIDTLDFPTDTEVLGASWVCTASTGTCTNNQAVGAGPYVLSASDTPIASLATLTYDLAVRFRYLTDATSGDCATGTGLSNSVALPAGQEQDNLTNTACLTGPNIPTSGLSLVKTGDAPDTIAVGSTIRYDFALENTGVVTLRNLAIADPLLDAPATCVALVLAPGARTTCSGLYTLKQADIDAGQVQNTATASGNVPIGDTVVTTPSSVTTPLVQTPSIELLKTAGTPSGQTAGSTLEYNFLITNTGNVTLSNIAVNDDLLDEDAACVSLILAPGASTTCSGLRTLTQQEIDAGSTTNTATAQGKTPTDTVVPSDPSSTTTEYVSEPSLSLVKSSGAPTAHAAGGTVPYSFLVTNTGNVTMTGLVVEDDLLDNPATCPITILAPGTSTTCTGLRTLTQEEINNGLTTNTAIVLAVPPSGDEPVGSPTSTTITNYDLTPALTMDKVALQTSYSQAGETVGYEYRLQNSGNVTISNLVITDDRISNVVCPATTIEPGEAFNCTADYIVDQSDIELGFITNIATVTGEPAGGTLDPVTDTETIQAIIAPAISVEKLAELTLDNRTQGLGDVDDVITYTVTVTNTGNVTLSGITVLDSYQNNAPTTLACEALDLIPGAQLVCEAYQHTITREEANFGGILTNIANASAVPTRDPSAPPVISSDTANIELVDPVTVLRVIKQAAPRDVRAGEIVRYSVSIENLGLTDADDVTLYDAPPAGFTLVENSLVVSDRDNQGRLSGISPFRVDQIDIDAGEKATISYLLRVGAGVRPGTHINTAVAVDGEFSSNTATAEVRLIGDPLMDESLILGTVFDDRDADGWQDTAHIDRLKAGGGLAAHVLQGNALINGVDAGTSLAEAISAGDLVARQSIADKAPQLIISQNVSEPVFEGDFTLSNAQGITVKMDAEGNLSRQLEGQAKDGLTAADPQITRTVSNTADGWRVDYTIRNEGIDERGIAGVRIASVEGLLIETDPYGRYHLEGIEGGKWERGRNFILSVDPASLPQGAIFTTENPRLRRITPGLPVRFDFGVQLPVEIVGGGSEEVVMKLAEVLFAPQSAEVRSLYDPVLEHLVSEVRKYGAGEIVITANGETHDLAYARAVSVRAAMAARLTAEELATLKVTVQTDREDTEGWVARIEDATVLGNVLFITDKSDILPEFSDLLDRVASTLEAAWTQDGAEMLVRLVGHTDVRASDAYNLRLGLRRSQAVYQALSSRLSPAVRDKLRVEVLPTPATTTTSNKN